MKKYHVKKGDAVVVNAGDWKGEKAKVTALLSKKDRVVLELTEMTDAKREKLGTRNIKKTRANSEGGRVPRALSVHVSNVSLQAAKSAE